MCWCNVGAGDLVKKKPLRIQQKVEHPTTYNPILKEKKKKYVRR